MPLISDSQLARIQNVVASKDRALAAAKHHMSNKKEQLIHTVEAVGAAGAVAYVRGKLESPTDGSWSVPGTTVDIESVIGVGLVAGSFFKLFGQYDADAAAAGSGVLAHYAGQLARKWSKTGTFSLVAGDVGGHHRHHVGSAQALANALDGTI